MGTIVLVPQLLARTGLLGVYTTPNGDGHTISNHGRMIIHFLNGSAGDCEVTVATPGQVDGLDIEELVVDVPAGEDWFIGPFPPKIYNTELGVTDVITATFEAVVDMTIAALIIPPD